ncbi:MAG TPA: HAMP domain-containing sensor histidine kinase [Vicinamibacteria bacterium]|nr:HAMP domain-containing sensor histidine kinase [Vicinamibacteria bacterium]
MNDPSSELERGQRLELLSAAGVAMAGSFDLRDILKETHRAGSKLLGDVPLDVLYLGRSSIHSRSLWFPVTPAPLNLSAAERDEIQSRLAGGACVETIFSEELVSGRSAMPLRYQDDLLGALVFRAPDDTRGEAVKLLSLLAQHASTALRNIHLAQERIHFERLSAIGRMIGTIVHDFRGPLTALRGYAGMVAGLSLSDTERRDYGRFMLEECDRLGHMVSELLEFTRGGPAELSARWVDLGEYLGSFAERLKRQYAGRGILVELTAAPGREVRIDGARLERALWNVATNACQAMPGGGVLSIRSASRGEEAVIEIEDRGCGIPEEIRHRVFEPFFSFGKSEGIGLGMATARKIVEEHGGEIEIESSFGRGTLVRFVIPLAGPKEPAEAA